MGHHPQVEHQQLVEVAADGVQIVVHHEHALALAAQALQQVDDGALGGRIHPRKRLIHEVDLRILGQRPGQEQPLLLAPGQLRDLPPGIVGHPHQVHRSAGRRARGAAHGAQPAQRPVQAHSHQVEGAHRVVPVDALALRHVSHEPPLLAVGLAVDAHRAGHPRHQIEHALEQGALAGAVGTDDAGDHAVGGRQVDVPQHRPPAVGDGQVAHHQRAGRGIERSGGWKRSGRAPASIVRGVGGRRGGPGRAAGGSVAAVGFAVRLSRGAGLGLVPARRAPSRSRCCSAEAGHRAGSRAQPTGAGAPAGRCSPRGGARGGPAHQPPVTGRTGARIPAGRLTGCPPQPRVSAALENPAPGRRRPGRGRRW